MEADAGEALVEGRVDEDDGVAGEVQVGLEEEGDVPDEGAGVGGGLFHLGGAGGGDEGVEEVFEALALGGVVEDAAGDERAVDVAGGEEGVGAPPLAELVLDGGGLVGGGDGVVGGEDEAAFVLEEAGDVALAGADAAGEADDGLGVEQGILDFGLPIADWQPVDDGVLRGGQQAGAHSAGRRRRNPNRRSAIGNP